MQFKDNHHDDESLWSGSSFTHQDSEEVDMTFYPSNTPGGFIVHAVTGEHYPYKIGTYESLRLFRVNICNGMWDDKGNKIPHGQAPNKSPNILYYDSVEDYEEHFHAEVTRKRATEWHTNVKFWFPGGNFSLENYTKSCKDNWLDQETLAQRVSKMPQNSEDKEEKKRQIANIRSYVQHHYPAFHNKRAEIEKFASEHPHYAIGQHFASRAVAAATRDDILNVLIPGSTPATGNLAKISAPTTPFIKT